MNPEKSYDNFCNSLKDIKKCNEKIYLFSSIYILSNIFLSANLILSIKKKINPVFPALSIIWSTNNFIFIDIYNKKKNEYILESTTHAYNYSKSHDNILDVNRTYQGLISDIKKII